MTEEHEHGLNHYHPKRRSIGVAQSLTFFARVTTATASGTELGTLKRILFRGRVDEIFTPNRSVIGAATSCFDAGRPRANRSVPGREPHAESIVTKRPR